MTNRLRRGTKRAAMALGLAAGCVVLALPATAAIYQPVTVIENPVNYTPNVQDDDVVPNASVYKITPLGDTIYVGGSFNTVTNAKRTASYVRHNFFSFNVTTKEVSPLAPDIDGAVWAIEPAPDGTLYVGGNFTSINGVPVHHLARYNPDTNAVVPAFVPRLGSSWGNVTDLKLVNDRLLAAGSFKNKLVALDPTTGQNTGYISLSISGKVPYSKAATTVSRIAVSPDHTRLVGIGNFASVGGQTRYHAFMASLGPMSATVTGWTSPRLDPSLHQCVRSEASYMRDVDFSPDGSYFVFATSGYRDPRDPKHPGPLTQGSMCDVAARFENKDISEDWTWVQRTGGDTLHSVAVTGSTIYVGGHQRWLDNPNGEDYAGPGAVSRPGVGALDPITGRALPWNPTTSRGVGMREITASEGGVWFGDDAKRFYGEWRWGIAFCPLPNL